eukprot:1632988-Pyramimonas_sp.AAC.1
MQLRKGLRGIGGRGILRALLETGPVECWVLSWRRGLLNALSKGASLVSEAVEYLVFSWRRDLWSTVCCLGDGGLLGIACSTGCFLGDGAH